MLRKTFVVFMVLIGLTAGCTQGSIPSDSTLANEVEKSTNITTPEKSIPATTVSSISPATTSTPIPKSPTLPPAASPTTSPKVFETCLQVQPGEEDYKDLGVIAFYSYWQDHQLSLFDLSSNKLNEIEPDGFGLVVSPDHTKFVYEGFETPIKIRLLAPDGNLISSVLADGNWGWIDRWVNNENISIYVVEPDAPGSRQNTYPAATLLLNPENGNTRILSPEFPGIDKIMFNNVIPWYPSTTTVYSPDLNRVVYPSTQDGIILYSIPEKRILAQIPAYFWDKHPPVWSPDGSKFIMMGDDEYFIVSNDGEVTKLTNLNRNGDPQKPESQNYFAQSYSWSPDNRHVAFWLKHGSTNKITLAMLDTADGDVYDYCIQAGFKPEDFIYSNPSPVWSPDGKSLLIGGNYHKDADGTEGNDVLLIDLEKHTVYKIASNHFPIGWLVKP